MTNNKTIFAADLFCGAGGTSSGLRDACSDLGLKLHLTAINHWDVAIATHSANHPDAEHLCESLDGVDPRKVIRGEKLRLLVASPECIHHSRARGGKPMSDQSRASAWHVLRWCEALQVQDVLVENVIEFREWGPLGANGLPLKRRKGETYQAFLNALRSLGYTVEDRVLCAADYGDPTSRKRLFIRARKGNRKITWPEPTHSPRGEATLFGKLPAYRAAREIIDWDDKGRSIFNRKRPLSPNTMKRILAGLRKFGGLPFARSVPNEGVHRGNAPQSVDDPVNPALSEVEGTITARRGAGHLVEPFVVMLAQRGENDARNADCPLLTVTAQGQHTPALTTSASAGASVGLAQPFILGQQSGGAPRSVNDPLPTITTDGAIAVVEPFTLRVAVRGGDDGYTRGASVDEPLPAITTPLRGAQAASPAVVEPFIVPVNHGKDDLRAYSMDKPLPTITSVDAWGLVEPYLIEYYSERDGQKPRVRSVDQPLQTVTAQNRIALVQPFLVKYYGTSQGASSVNEPLDTVMARDRFALVLPVGDGHVLVDIRFRMLKPDELARAHSFRDYEFHGTREQVVRQIGNSVPVQLAKALCASALI